MILAIYQPGDVAPPPAERFGVQDGTVLMDGKPISDERAEFLIADWASQSARNMDAGSVEADRRASIYAKSYLPLWRALRAARMQRRANPNGAAA